MDRTTIYAIALSTIGLTLIGGIYFSPSRAPVGSSSLSERTVFAKEDVRYKYQQEALKDERKNKGKRRRAAPPPDDVPEGIAENEEPPVDESAEAPPIE